MAIIRGKLIDIQFVSATTGVLYANPATTKSFIGGITLFNGNTTAESVKLYNVPDSSGSVGTAAPVNQFLDVSLEPLETFVFEFPADGAVLSDLNDTIQGVTNTGSKVTIQFHGALDQ